MSSNHSLFWSTYGVLCSFQHPLLYCFVSSLYGYSLVLHSSHLMIVFGPSLLVRVVSCERVMSVSASCLSVADWSPTVPFQGDSLQTNIQLDFGDGTAVSYSNLSWTEEGIKHIYKSAGIFRVTALAENTLGYDTTTLFLHVTCKFCCQVQSGWERRDDQIVDTLFWVSFSYYMSSKQVSKTLSSLKWIPALPEAEIGANYCIENSI